MAAKNVAVGGRVPHSVSDRKVSNSFWLAGQSREVSFHQLSYGLVQPLQESAVPVRM